MDQASFADLGLFGAEFLEKLFTEILQLGIAIPSMQGLILKSPRFGNKNQIIVADCPSTIVFYESKPTSSWTRVTQETLYEVPSNRRYHTSARISLSHELKSSYLNGYNKIDKSSSSKFYYAS